MSWSIMVNGHMHVYQDIIKTGMNSIRSTVSLVSSEQGNSINIIHFIMITRM